MTRHRPRLSSINALFPLVARSITDGMIITDSNGRTTWINAGFTRLCGYTLAELRGQKPGTVLQGSRTDLHTIEHIRSAIRARQSSATEILNYHKNGHPYWTALHITPIRYRRGKGVQFVALAYDITARKAVDQGRERIEHDLKDGFLPRCAWCSRVRDAEGDWHTPEDYFTLRTGILYTHGICPTCNERLELQQYTK